MPSPDQRGNGFPREVNGTVDIGAFEGTVTLNPTVYIVDLTSDTGVGSGNTGDLLYCITQANANPNTAGSEIEFDPTVFATPQTIKLTSTLELNEPAGPELIDGPGASLVTVSGNNAVEVFQVASGATATLTGLTISDGRAGFGGGIGNRGTLTVTDCTLSDNQATSGGGIDNSGTLTVTGGTIENNSAFGTSTSTGSGGGINNVGGTVTITGTTLASNQAADFTSVGGGIENNGGVMSITDSTLSDNSANGTTSEGGGIDNEGAGTLTIAGSTLSGNSAFAGSGGGIFNGLTGTVTVTGTSTLANTAGANGAGFMNVGTMTVVDSTIANNNTGGIGGGIDNLAGGTLSVVNSTIAGNSGFDGGGGIGSQGKLTSLNCTITDNSFGNSGGYGGGIGVDGGTATLNNTIVALNTNGTGNAARADDIDTIGGTVIGSFNLVGVGGAGGLSNGSNGNLVGVANPLLGALADNGGPTQTIALLAGSPAINAGNFAPGLRAAHRPARHRLPAGSGRDRGHRGLRSPGGHQQPRAHFDHDLTQPDRGRLFRPPHPDRHGLGIRQSVGRQLELDRAGDGLRVVDGSDRDDPRERLRDHGKLPRHRGQPHTGRGHLDRRDLPGARRFRPACTSTQLTPPTRSARRSP